MDLLQSTNQVVPVPVRTFGNSLSIALPDPTNVGAGYSVVWPSGTVVAGGGGVTNNTPVAGMTLVTLLPGVEQVEEGDYTIVLLDGGGNVVSSGVIQGRPFNGGAWTALLHDAAGNANPLVTTPNGTSIDCQVTVGTSAVLGPYFIQVYPPGGNAAGEVYGRIVTSLPTAGLDAAGVRAALGMASANMDTQLGNIITQIATRAAPGAAMTLTAGERNSVASALLDFADAVETGLTPRQAMRLASAILGGLLVQTAPGVWQFKGAGVATARVTASIPGDGSRPSMILNL